MTKEEFSAPQEDSQIPDVSVAELNELGMKDLPSAYFRVNGVEGRHPQVEEHIVDNTDEHLAQLSKIDRAILREFLSIRKTMMDPDTRTISIMAEGLGAIEKRIASLDLTLMVLLTPALQGYNYTEIGNGHPNNVYAGWLSNPEVGDILISGRQFTHLYPAGYKLSTGIALDTIGLGAKKHATFNDSIRVFRPEAPKK